MFSETTDTSWPARNRRIALWCAVCALASTVMPLVWGRIHWGSRFLWVGPVDSPDQAFYVSIMRQGAAGCLRMLNLYSTEPQTPQFMHFSYLLLGLASAWLRISPLVMFHIGHVLFGALLLGLCWFAVINLIKDRLAQLYAYALICFSAGLGWLFKPSADTTSPLDVQSLDLWMDEATTFRSLAVPHYAFATALKFGALICLYLGMKRKQPRYALLAGLCCGLLVFEHPYQLPSIAVAAIVYAAVLVAAARLGERKATLRDAAVQLSLTAAAAAPYLLVGWLQTRHSVLLHLRMSYPDGPTPSLLLVLEGYGALAPLAVWGAWTQHRGGAAMDREAAWFLATLSLVGALLMYPLSHVWFARRMILGAHIPIAMLAGAGLSDIAARLARKRARYELRSAAVGALLILCALTNIAAFCRAFLSFSQPVSPTHECRYTLTSPEVAAVRWIVRNTSTADVVQVLPSVFTSDDGKTCYTDLFLMEWEPALTGRQTFAGHFLETYGFPGKLRHLESLDVRDSPIDYLVFAYGRYCPLSYARLLEPQAPPGLARVYSGRGVMIYRVVHA